MKFRIAVMLALVGLCSWQPTALGQVNEQFADMADEIELVRSVARTERKAIVTEAMKLDSQESATFWPVYYDYRTEVTRLHDRLLKLISDYAAQRDTLTDAQARALLDDYLGYERKLLDVRRKYVKRFAKSLSMVKVARFYQVENKLDALQRLGLASAIPLAE